MTKQATLEQLKLQQRKQNYSNDKENIFNSKEKILKTKTTITKKQHKHQQ